MSQVLLDECVPRRLTKDFPKGAVTHVCDHGWQGLRNGRLLGAMRTEQLSVLVTVDKNIPFQQNIAASGIAVIVLHARSNRRADLKPLVPAIIELIAKAQAGHVYQLGA